METLIRHIEKRDTAGIKAIYDQPHVVAGTLQSPYQSLQQWEKRLGEMEQNAIGLVALRQERIVGQLGLHTRASHRRKHVAMPVVAVCASAEGQGVADALLKAGIELCDNWMNIHRMELHVFTDNTRAINLYKRNGFTIEGELQHYGFKAGRTVNAYIMGRIRQPTDSND